MSMLIDFIKSIRKWGLEFFGVYYSTYQAKVLDNRDPQDQGRILVQVPATGIRGPLAKFAYPVSPYAGNGFGLYFPPEVGEIVAVYFEHGKVDNPRYIGGWWRRYEDPENPLSRSQIPGVFRMRQADSAVQIGDLLQQAPERPTSRGIKTRGGHELVFEDTQRQDPDDETVDKQARIKSAGGYQVVMNDSERMVTVITPDGNLVEIRDGTVRAEAADVTIDSSIVMRSSGGSTVEILDSKTILQDGSEVADNGRVRMKTSRGQLIEIQDDDEVTVEDDAIKTTMTDAILAKDWKALREVFESDDYRDGAKFKTKVEEERQDKGGITIRSLSKLIIEAPTISGPEGAVKHSNSIIFDPKNGNLSLNATGEIALVTGGQIRINGTLVKMNDINMPSGRRVL